MNWNVIFCQQIGKNKSHNQDALFNGQSVFQYKLKKSEEIDIKKSKLILGVCDGISHSNNAHHVSKFVMEKLLQCKNLTTFWVKEVQQELADSLSLHFKGSATTFVACEIDEQGLCKIINVGDSRAYKITQLGKWQQLSFDHTILAEMQQQGLAEKNIRYSGIYNGLTDCLIADNEDYYFKIFSAEYQLNKGDTILLCSDGFYNDLSEKLRLKIWTQYQSNVDKLTVCRKMVKKHHTYDDFSVVMCHFN